MRKFVFKPFKGDNTSSPDDSTTTQTQVQRRREQVRRAQKTHRERKEAYTSSLESEVVRLRASKARLETQTKALFAENTALKQLMTQHGIPVPTTLTREHHAITTNSSVAAASNVSSPGYNSSSPSSSDAAASDETLTLSVAQEDRTSKKRNWRKQVYVQHTYQTHSSSSSPATFTQFVSPPPSGSATPNTLPSNTPTTAKTSLGSLDPEIIGTDFVLTLESPCLSHIDVLPISSPTSDDTSVFSSPPTSASTATFSPLNTGHALTLSACVLHNHPSPPGQRQHSPQPWRVPRASLSQLLALSAAIPLGDTELTPVQAWEYVRKQQGFAELEVGRWEALKEKLVGGIKCHGFGGVVERELLENSVFEAFVVGKVF